MTIAIEIGHHLPKLPVRIGRVGGIGDGVARHALADRHRGLHLGAHLAARVAIGQHAPQQKADQQHERSQQDELKPQGQRRTPYCDPLRPFGPFEHRLNWRRGKARARLREPDRSSAKRASCISGIFPVAGALSTRIMMPGWQSSPPAVVAIGLACARA